MKLGVLIPCRDEAAVVERKLRNLALCAWPAERAGHRIVIVDDGSTDGTAAIARAAAAPLTADGALPRVDVIANADRPGKPGALRTGLAALAGSADLVVLSDADVVLEPDALVALLQAFEADARLAMASGSQRFVRDLAGDGSCRAADGGEPVAAGSTFDRWTARVRALESRAGVLFSVHGQLLAWRTDLGLVPALGVAADDLDLRFQVKARAREPRRVERVPAARFLEIKTPAGDVAREQAMRRARAWFQALDRGHVPARGLLERVQAAAYRHLPRHALALTHAVPVLAAGAALAWLGPWWVPLPLALAIGFHLSPLGRRWVALATLIAAARARERREPLAERWEMTRT